ncbi:MAG: exosortase/archaeosortase family protein [Chloroflexota bacterium]
MIQEPISTPSQNTQSSSKQTVGLSDMAVTESSISAAAGNQPLRHHQRWYIVGIIVAFGLLTWPTWQWLWREWMANEYYSHGILVLPAAIFLAWRRLTLDPEAQPSWLHYDYRSLLLLGISLILYVYWLNDRAYYLAAFAMVGLVAGLVGTTLSWRTLRHLIFPICYLAMMVPIPIIERTTYPLALFTGVCSGALVRFFGLPIHIVGNAVQMPGTDLLIGAQCSGINSMITLIALTSLCAYLFNGPLWGKIGLVLLAIPLSMLGNILRVGNLLYIAYYWGVDAAFTFYHDYSGFVFFALVLLLLLPLLRLLRLKSLRMDVI